MNYPLETENFLKYIYLTKVQGQLERTRNRTNKNINLARARDEGDAIDTIFGFERFKQVSYCASLALADN